MQQVRLVFNDETKYQYRSSLTLQGKIFMENYIRLITNNKSKAISKDLIRKYHKLIRNINKSIRPMNRDELRRTSIYFSSHAPQRDLILHALQTLINNGTINYEQDLKNQK